MHRILRTAAAAIAAAVIVPPAVSCSRILCGVRPSW